jgi:prolipoprotein diacylglyceryltransferase
VLFFIPSPHTGVIHIGPLQLHMYGLTLLVAILACVWLTGHRWKAMGGDWDLVTRVWKGGLGIWGGILFGALAGAVVVKRSGYDVAKFLDAAAPGLLLAQGIGRIGNWWNQELYGKPTKLPWGLEISVAHRPLQYLDRATFHPTFLYELIWNLALAAFLVWLGHRRRIRPPGLFALYVTGYSAFRIFEESLRVDPAHYILGLRLNFYVACLLTVGGAAWFAISQRPREQSSGNRRRRWTGLFAVGWATIALSGCGLGAASSLSGGAGRAIPNHRPPVNSVKSGVGFSP